MTEFRLKYRGTLFPMRKGEVTLGRSGYASIVVNNPLASRDHAVVRTVGGKLEVADLSSKNGTFVNGQRVTDPRLVGVGDLIKIGTDVVEIQLASIENPNDLRVATARLGALERAPEGDTTANVDCSLELAESLVAECANPSARAMTAEGIRRVVDNFLVEVGSKVSRADCDRVRRLSKTLSSWGLGDDFDEWRRSLEAHLGSRQAGAMPVAE